MGFGRAGAPWRVRGSCRIFSVLCGEQLQVCFRVLSVFVGVSSHSAAAWCVFSRGGCPVAVLRLHKGSPTWCSCSFNTFVWKVLMELLLTPLSLHSLSLALWCLCKESRVFLQVWGSCTVRLVRLHSQLPFILCCAITELVWYGETCCTSLSRDDL